MISIFLVVVVASHGIRALVRAAPLPSVRTYIVASEAMAPTLKTGDVVHVIPSTTLRRQDIVLCRWPGAARPSFWRVIGLPGERVEIRHKRLYINGHPLPDPHAHF